MGKIKKHIIGAIITFVICEIICSEAQTSCLSPVSNCTCQIINTKLIINCRDRRLTQIPTFNNTNIEYDELTFSSAYQTPTCSTCNRITSIPARSFANLKVKRIDLSKNGLTNISNDAFAGVEPYLKELLLEGSGTKEPNYAALNNLTGLTSLSLANFKQTQFSSNNISGPLQNLESLMLISFKNVSVIESSTFLNKFPKLKMLWIEECALKTYPAGAFLNIPSLQELHFINNDVTQLYSLSFKDLHNLTELYLKNNLIELIDTDTFAGIIDTLEVLDLSVNKIGYKGGENLFFLSSKNWTKLEQLILSYNMLDTLPDGTFRNMPKLTYLNLQDCQLSTLSNGLLLGLQNLHTLDVSINRILDISVNAFIHTPQLTDLRLYDDSKHDYTLNFPPAAVENIRTSLNHLTLAKKQVNNSQIWEIVQILNNLEELELQDTNLVSIPDFVFRNHAKLQVLHLSNNKLTSVNQKSFHGLKDILTTLSLSSNNLATIDECVFKNFSKLNSLYLSENMWNCDCHLLWLYDWIKMKIVTDPDITHLVQCMCFYPSDLNGTFIQDINRSALICTPAYVPITCPDYYATTTTTTTTTPKPLPVFKTAVTEVLIFSINVTWTISDKNDVTGYILNLVNLQNTGIRNQSRLTKDTTLFRFRDLKPQQAYNICLQVELNNVLNQNLISCVTNSTKPIPNFELLPNLITESSIEVKWNVSDMTEITGFRLNIAPLSSSANKHYQNVTRDGSTFHFKNLTSKESYLICLELIINGQVYEKLDECKTMTLITSSTDPPKVTSEPQQSNEKIPIIVGAVVGAVLFIVIIVIIVYILIRRKKPDKKYMNTEPALERFDTHELPHAGQTTRTFTKSKPGAAKVDDIQVKVISNGNVNDTRVSGGSYQFLNERDSRNVNPVPSTSNVNPHYINDIRSRMLPNPPGKGFQAPHPHAYVNTGYDTKYDPHTKSSDPKRQAKGASENLKAGGGTAGNDSKPNPDSIYYEIDLNGSTV